MIADFKSPDAEKLKEITGADLEIIKENLLNYFTLYIFHEIY